MACRGRRTFATEFPRRIHRCIAVTFLCAWHATTEALVQVFQLVLSVLRTSTPFRKDRLRRIVAQSKVPILLVCHWEKVELLLCQHRQPYGCRWDRRADRSGGRRFQKESVEASEGRPGRNRNAWEAADPCCRNDLDALVRLNEASTRTWPKPCAC